MTIVTTRAATSRATSTVDIAPAPLEELNTAWWRFADLQTFDRLTAIALGAGSAGGLGWTAAQLPMFSTPAAAIPADVLLTAAAGALGAAATIIAFTAARNWRADRPTGTILAIGERAEPITAALAIESAPASGRDEDAR